MLNRKFANNHSSYKQITMQSIALPLIEQHTHIFKWLIL